MWFIPAYAVGRIDLKFGKFTPFGDIKLGANLSNGGGIYFSPSIGYRFNWGYKVGLNIGVGLSLIGYQARVYDMTDGNWSSFESHYIGTKHHANPYFSFRVGFDF